MTQALSAALAATAPTMSSLEIADRIGKRHDHVMRDIRVMLIALHGVGGLPNFGDTPRNEQNGQSYPIFRLPKRECIILVTGYSIPMRAAVVDCWAELEAQVAGPAEAARALAGRNASKASAARWPPKKPSGRPLNGALYSRK
ncbi:Rha family transcriptional regulator [Methylorubrum thiocyanatum]